MGWIGTMGQVLHYLATVRADRDENGSFLVRPHGSVSTFMDSKGDDAECVVSGSAEYRIGDRWANLSAGLSSTSYGQSVRVI